MESRKSCAEKVVASQLQELIDREIRVVSCSRKINLKVFEKVRFTTKLGSVKRMRHSQSIIPFGFHLNFRINSGENQCHKH